ncbi:ABC transporter substrate-binding protein [Tessaracoccus coleopterorum]|uniref:ABC transporter substrate-binding protein n=1 Tax=Tessaracoccus coleopterorum TaxID=2714950 RepID=UPI0038CD166A
MKANPEAFFPAQADTLILKFLTGDVATAQLQTGELDIAEVAATDVAALEAEGVKIISVPGNKVMALHNSIPSGKLDDVRVRQAIMYAIDREAIIDSILAGKGRLADSMMFQPDWAQSPDMNPYEYDPEKARQLLKEANWDAKTELNLDIVPGQADRDAVFRIIVGQLQEVGINAVIRNHQSADLTTFVNNFELDLLISPYTQTVPEPAALAARLTCDSKIPNGSNITGYCNEKVDKLFAEAVTKVDDADRAPIYQEINKILNEELPNFPSTSPISMRVPGRPSPATTRRYSPSPPSPISGRSSVQSRRGGGWSESDHPLRAER